MNNIRIYLSMSADGVGGEDEDDSLLIYYLFLFRGEKEETKKIVNVLHGCGSLHLICV